MVPQKQSDFGWIMTEPENCYVKTLKACKVAMQSKSSNKAEAKLSVLQVMPFAHLLPESQPLGTRGATHFMDRPFY